MRDVSYGVRGGGGIFGRVAATGKTVGNVPPPPPLPPPPPAGRLEIVHVYATTGRKGLRRAAAMRGLRCREGDAGKAMRDGYVGV